MDESLSRVAFWLLPDADTEVRLRAIIAQLAAQFGAPEFAPHMTVCVGLRLGDEQLKRIIEQAAALIDPLPLRVRGIRDSEKYTRTVFIEFEQDDQLTDFKCKVADLTSSRDTYEFVPHSSLIYKKLDPGLRRKILKLLVLPSKTVVFDRIVAMRVAASVDTEEDVRAWRVSGVAAQLKRRPG